MTIPVIIDCDPGIDDVMALTLAFAHPELDIRLITTAAGNQEQEKTVYNALAFTSYMKKKIEIAKGLEKPFFRKLYVAENVHGEAGLGGVQFPKPTTIVSEKTAIEAMKELLLESNEPIVLIATGPLTNIGALFLAHPEVKKKIKYLSLMGGAAVGGNISPTAEFNMYVDPHAAEIVLQSGVPIVMSGLDVTHKAYITLKELEQIEAIGTDLARKIVAMLKFYVSSAKSTAFHGLDYEKRIRLHDVCAVSYVLTPELFDGDDYYVTVELEGRYTSGTTVVDYNERTGLPKNVKVLHTVSRELFVKQFLAAIRALGI